MALLCSVFWGGNSLSKGECVAQRTLRCPCLRRNVHVLREQLEAAEARARRNEELLAAQGPLAGRVAELESQLQRWTLILEVGYRYIMQLSCALLHSPGTFKRFVM